MSHDVAAPPPGLLERVAEHILGRTGLWLGGSRASALRIAVRATLGDLTSEEYFARLERGNELYEQVLEMLTVGETYFFRGDAQIDFIRRTVLPDLAERDPSRRLRVWSAGCSTGEEPYTMAILAREAGLLHRMDVHGTDISRQAIETGRQGRYRKWALRSTDGGIVSRYFTERKQWFELAPEIREAVELHRLNLLEEKYPEEPGGFDLILCRNVLMYLHPERAAEVGRRLAGSLRDGGWLLLGGSDPILSDLGAHCRLMLTDAGLVYRSGHHERVEEHPRSTPSQTNTVPSVDAPSVFAWKSLAAEPAPPSPPASSPFPDSEPHPDPVDRAMELYEAGDAQGALRLVDEIADSRIWLGYARTLADCGDLGNATEALSLALDRHPLDPELRLLQGFVLGEANRLTEAVHAARSAIYLDRYSLVAHLLLAGLLNRMGDERAAERVQREARRLMAFSASPPHDQPEPGPPGPSLGALP